MNQLIKEQKVKTIKVGSSYDNYTTLVSGKLGFLQFGPEKPTVIGRADARPFKLLRAVNQENFRSVEVIFSFVMQKEDQKDTLLSGSTLNARRVEIIKNAIKELQRGKKIKDKLDFVWSKYSKGLKVKIL